MKNETFIHDSPLFGIRLLSPHHIEKIGTVGKIVPGRDILLSFPASFICCDNRGKLCDLMESVPAVAGG